MASIWLVIVLTCLHFKGLMGVSLTLEKINQSDLKTKCRSGLIKGEEFIANAKIDASGANGKRAPFVFLFLQGPLWNVSQVCRVNITPNECANPQPAKKCYCVKYDDETKIYTAKMIFTAQLDYGKSMLFMTWPPSQKGRQDINSSKIYMPAVFDDNAYDRIFINKTPVSFFEDCKLGLHLQVNKRTRFEFCSKTLPPTQKIHFIFDSSNILTKVLQGVCTHVDFTPREKHNNKMYTFRHTDENCMRNFTYTCLASFAGARKNYCIFPKFLNGQWISTGNSEVIFTRSYFINEQRSLSGTKRTVWRCEKMWNTTVLLRLIRQQPKPSYICLYLGERKPEKMTFWIGPREKTGQPLNAYLHTTGGEVDHKRVCNMADGAPPDRKGVLIRNNLAAIAQVGEQCPAVLSNRMMELLQPKRGGLCASTMSICLRKFITFLRGSCLPSYFQSELQTFICVHSEVRGTTTYLTILQMDSFLGGNDDLTFQCLAIVKGTDMTIMNQQNHTCEEIKVPTKAGFSYRLTESAIKCSGITQIFVMGAKGPRNPGSSPSCCCTLMTAFSLLVFTILFWA